MRKRLIVSLGLLLALLLPVTAVLSADSWQFYFPITITDNSSTTRTAYPIILEVGGEHLHDQGYMTANGTDARLRTTADKNLLMSTDNIVFVVDSLPAYGQVTYNLHTGYSPEISAFQIIVGDGGYVTVADNTTIELGDNFTSEQSGWVDTLYSANKTLIKKADAFETYISDNETITSIMLQTDALTYQVNASTDDIEKHWNGAAWVVDNSGVAIYAGWIAVNAEDYGCGMLFKDILLSQGQTITASSLNLTSGGNQANAVVRSRITGQDSDNASTFSDLADFDARPRTTANITWDNIGAWVTDTEYESIDIASIIQEIVDRPGWVSGNSIVIFWEDFESRSTEANNTERIARSFDSDPAKAPQLNITATAVTATGVASGEHKITTSANGTYMWIAVDDVIQDTIALGGASVPDNANDWLLLRYNVMPYADNITITVGGNLELWFEPNEMITGTTLPDRATSVANDGTITWGTNDQVTIVFGSVTSYEATVSVATVNVTGWVLPLVGIPDNWWGMEFDGEDLPFYPTFLDTSTQTGIPLQTLYLLVVFGAAIALATVTIVLTKSVLVGVAFYTVTMAYGANAGIVAWWIIYVFLIMVIGIVFLSNRQAMGG